MTLNQMTIAGRTANRSIGFPRTWNLGFELFDNFSGDALNRAVGDLSSLDIYDAEAAAYRPLTRDDLADAVHKERKSILLGHAYRVYVRYRPDCNPYQFNGIQIIDKLALTGPRENAIKVGEIDLAVKPFVLDVAVQ